MHCNNRCRWELNWSGLFSSNCNTNSCFSVPVWFELNFFLVVSKLSVIVFYALFFSHHYSKFCFLHLIKISILHMLQVKLPCTTRMPIQRTFLAKNSPKKPMKVENTLKQYTSDGSRYFFGHAQWGLTLYTAASLHPCNISLLCILTKGQIISKTIFVFPTSPKKRTKKWKNLTWHYYVTSSQIFFVRFFGESRTP